jgi:hydrogenase maturation protein HypF
MIKRKRYEINGTVQGVGFRPMVYRLAEELKLTGRVFNSSLGVIAEVEGSEEVIARFEKRLYKEKPVLSKITDIKSIDQKPRNTTEFTIAKSEGADTVFTHIPPDTALCKECENELFNVADRRYLFPFISCVNCGPRFTIVKSLPYDRPSTSMNIFKMCDRCTEEYINPKSRRFHAQPIACHNCGSVLNFSIDSICESLLSGKIVALKALGGFLLCCDATNNEAVTLLRERKNRPHKPLAVLFPNIESIEKECAICPAERKLILSNRAPITLVKKGKNYSIAEGAAPGIDRLGVMLSSSPIQYIIMRKINRPIIATSANISDESVIIDEDTLFERLSGVFDVVLTHNRDIINACDDSVAQIVSDDIMLIRRARGFAPQALNLTRAIIRPTIAVGARQKNTIALGFDKSAVVSQHIGDLESVSSVEYFERTIRTFKRLYKFEPERIVCDLHPSYASARWAREQPLPVTAVQHHHAHALAVMAEYGLESPVIAVAWDGTGYGDDGTIWGGEFLIARYDRFDRAATIKPFRLIGGDHAIKDLKRIAFAALYDYNIDHPLLNDIENANFKRIIEANINSIPTSSIGRVFDAAAFLMGIEQNYTFEGASGLKIEALFDKRVTDSYPFENHCGVIDLKEIFKGILRDPPMIASSRFINSLANIAVETVKDYDLPVVLCGGVFQNKTLTSVLIKKLSRLGKKTYISRWFPPNDGAISLGQLVYAGSFDLLRK